MSGIYGNDLRKIMRINSQIPIFPGQKAEIGHFDRPLRRQVKNLFSDIRRKKQLENRSEYSFPNKNLRVEI